MKFLDTEAKGKSCQFSKWEEMSTRSPCKKQESEPRWAGCKQATLPTG
jgi:hypothetical protein